MADETTNVGAETKEVGQTFDPKAIEAMVQGAVRTSIEQLVKDSQAKQAEVDAESAARKAAEPKTDPMGDLFKPALEPAMAAARNAETRAALAADAVDFYTANAANPDVLKHRGKIEKVVTEQLKKGNVISRTDAWSWLRGGELYEELGKERLTAHEQKLKEAREAQAAGPSTTVPKFTKPIDELKTDELGEVLKGVTF